MIVTLHSDISGRVAVTHSGRSGTPRRVAGCSIAGAWFPCLALGSIEVAAAARSLGSLAGSRLAQLGRGPRGGVSHHALA